MDIQLLNIGLHYWKVNYLLNDFDPDLGVCAVDPVRCSFCLREHVGVCRQQIDYMKSGGDLVSNLLKRLGRGYSFLRKDLRLHLNVPAI